MLKLQKPPLTKKKLSKKLNLSTERKYKNLGWSSNYKGRGY